MCEIVYLSYKRREFHDRAFLPGKKRTKVTERTIYCYIQRMAKGKTIQINTKESIKPEYWDQIGQRATERGKTRYSGAKELNSFLDSLSEDIKKTIPPV